METETELVDYDWIDCPKCGANDWDVSERDQPGEPIICKKCGNWEFA